MEAVPAACSIADHEFTEAGRWLHRRGGAAAALVRARLRHALTQVDSRSSRALRLRSRLAAELAFAAGESAGMLAVVEESRDSPDPVVRADVLGMALQCLFGPHHGDVRRALATELIGLSVRTERQSDLVMGSLFRTSTMFLDGDLRAEQSLAEVRGLAADGADDVDLVVAAIDVMLAVRAGRLVAAERLARDCAERARLAGHPEADTWWAMHLIMIRAHQLRLPELTAMIEELVNRPTRTSADYCTYVSVLALARALAGDERGARSALARLRRHGVASLPRTSDWLVMMSSVIMAGRLVGDVDACVEAYELLRPHAHQPVMAGLGIACFGSVRTVLGAACLAAGRIEPAIEYFRQGILDNEALGHRPAVAFARVQYLRARKVRNGPRNTAVAGVRRPTAAARDGSARPRLSRTEVARLAEGVLGAPPDADLLDQILTAGGDRRLSRLLIEGLAEEQRIHIDAGTARSADGGPPYWSPPQRVRVEVGMMLAGLTARCRQLLYTAAALGTRIDPERVARTLGDRTAALLPAWEEAMSSELMQADGDELVFGNELLRQAVAQSLPRSIRAALQRELTQVEGDAQIGGPPAVPDTVPDPAVVDGLTAREQQVLSLLARGHINKQMASALGISSHAVKRHVSSLLIKLRCTNRTELALYVVRREAEGQRAG
jgi:DNA-binding CsgD family transcriptional regulator